MGKAIGAFFGRTDVQAAAALATVAAARSFQPSLMPRPKLDQALATAGSVVSAYATARLIVRATEASGKAVGLPPVVTHGATAVAAGAAGMLISEDQSRRLALLSTGATVKSWAAAAAFAIEASKLVSRGRWWGPAGELAGITAVSGLVLREQLRNYERDGRPSPEPEDTAYSLAVGLGIATGVGLIATAERAAVAGGHRLIGGPRWLTRPALQAVLLAGAAAAGRTGFKKLLTKIEQGNDRVEVEYAEEPTSTAVSAGPGSSVSFADLSIQGRRFVLEASERTQIEEVMGEPALADPVRVYVGLSSAPSIEDRASLAIDELRRTGAFDRSILIVGSPAGTGYFNYIPIEAAEYMTRGDAASVAVQYGKRPSMLSLDRLPIAARQYRLLLERILTEIQGMERRPRLLLYGESLGAQAGQEALAGLDIDGVDALGIGGALWVGTPYATEWSRGIRSAGDPRLETFDSINDYLELTEPQRSEIRYFFLDHNEDPVTRFGLDSAYRRPPWLGPPFDRPEKVTQTHQWVPAVSFWQLALDTKNAATVIPGEFYAKGHDYRADLAEFVRAAFNLGPVDAAQMERVEAALRRSEVERSSRIAAG